MKKYHVIKILCLLSALTVLSHCGGGSGGGGTTTSGDSPQTVTAVVRLGIASQPTGTVCAVQAIVHLPSGVTVKATQNPPQTDNGVVTSSGADLVMGIYSSASGTVTVYVARASGITVSDFAQLHGDVSSGSSPTATDFRMTDLSAWDENGALISGLTPTFTVTIK